VSKDLRELMRYVVDRLLDGLTGGTAELPLPDNVMINWVTPGVPFSESAFDFAIAGPYAGPTELTLPYFRSLVESLMGDGGLERANAIEEAKRMYQQHLLGTYEGWSRFMNFIPLPNPTVDQSRWTAQRGQGKYGHVSVVYGQANRTLSDVYRDTLLRCEVADDELTEEQKKLVERMRALLTETVTEEDFLTGQQRVEDRESRAMTEYKRYRAEYENAVIDYAQRLARANNGSAADLIEWQRSGGIYRRRATEALRTWIANGHKNKIETAQATLNHILGSSMVLWKDNLVQIVEDIENNTSGVYGYPFYPASVLPGDFARSDGWTRFEESDLKTAASYRTSSHSGRGTAGLSLGVVTIGGAGGASREETNFSLEGESFKLKFEFTTVEIMRPWFHPNFFLSRGWRPKDTFINEYGPVHSDGGDPPKGALIGYPTKALFIRRLEIESKSLAQHVSSKSSTINGGGLVSCGIFTLGGQYQQADRSGQSNFSVSKDKITVGGIQLMALISPLFPHTANPDPKIKKWI
jgi:hypothetical protein